MLGLEELMARRPAQLSGGQRQRVAMGRALVREPQVFLLDEPLSNLDAKLRTTMRAELARLHERLGITTVYVTHDQVEAMTLGQRVAVLRDGVLQQFGDPQELFHRPVNLFVAAFIGSPTMNLVSAPVRRGARRVRRATRCRCRRLRAARRATSCSGCGRASFELDGTVDGSGAAADGGRGRGRRGARRRGAGLVPRRRARGRGRGGPHRRRAAARRRPRHAVRRARARARGRAHRRARSSSRSTTASCTCSTRERARAARGGERQRRGATPQPARARHLRVRRGRLRRARERRGPVAAGVERGEEAAERRVAAADRVGAEARRGGAEELAVGRRELHPVGAVGDRGRARPAARVAQRRRRRSMPSSAASCALTFTKSGPPRGRAGGLAADVERHAGAGLAGDAQQPRRTVGRRAGRERARDADPARAAPRRAPNVSSSAAQCAGVELRPGLVELGQRAAVADATGRSASRRARRPRRSVDALLLQRGGDPATRVAAEQRDGVDVGAERVRRPRGVERLAARDRDDPLGPVDLAGPQRRDDVQAVDRRRGGDEGDHARKDRASASVGCPAVPPARPRAQRAARAAERRARRARSSPAQPRGEEARVERVARAGGVDRVDPRRRHARTTSPPPAASAPSAPSLTTTSGPRAASRARRRPRRPPPPASRSASSRVGQQHVEAPPTRAPSARRGSQPGSSDVVPAARAAIAATSSAGLQERRGDVDVARRGEQRGRDVLRAEARQRAERGQDRAVVRRARARR